jgi:AcrR family transcriptional regulator
MMTGARTGLDRSRTGRSEAQKGASGAADRDERTAHDASGNPSNGSPVGSRQQLRSDRSTRELIAAAGDLISEVGYSGMTLAAVGERAGYSRGLASTKFGSKEGLLMALLNRITVDWRYRNVLTPESHEHARDLLLSFLRAVHNQVQTDARGMKVLYGLIFEALSPIPELQRYMREFHVQMRRELADILRQGQADGSVTLDVVPEHEADLIVAALRGIAYQWALDPEHYDPAPALAYLTATLEHHLAPRTAPRSRENRERPDRRRNHRA